TGRPRLHVPASRPRRPGHAIGAAVLEIDLARTLAELGFGAEALLDAEALHRAHGERQFAERLQHAFVVEARAGAQRIHLAAQPLGLLARVVDAAVLPGVED